MLNVVKWETLTYAETHAGAGIDDASQQTQRNKHHIFDLENSSIVRTIFGNSSFGFQLRRSLNSWWATFLDKADFQAVSCRRHVPKEPQQVCHVSCYGIVPGHLFSDDPIQQKLSDHSEVKGIQELDWPCDSDIGSLG